MGMIQDWRVALGAHIDEAKQAKDLLDSWLAEPLPRVPGMDTVSRLALRIFYGRTIEEAAAREYLYRWQLAIKEPDQCMLPHNSTRDPVCSVFGTPHTIGM